MTTMTIDGQRRTQVSIAYDDGWPVRHRRTRA
jgi:hypothetical protein